MLDFPNLLNDDIQKSEAIVGGLADNIPVSEFDLTEVLAGAKVEREHTKSIKQAIEIARDHLTENPLYYQQLKLIEKPKNDKTQLNVPKPLVDIYLSVRKSGIKANKLTEHLLNKLSRTSCLIVKRYLESAGIKPTVASVFNTLKDLNNDQNNRASALSHIKLDNDKFKATAFLKKDLRDINQWLNTTSPEKVVKDIQNYDKQTRIRRPSRLITIDLYKLQNDDYETVDMHPSVVMRSNFRED